MTHLKSLRRRLKHKRWERRGDNHRSYHYLRRGIYLSARLDKMMRKIYIEGYREGHEDGSMGCRREKEEEKDGKEML